MTLLRTLFYPVFLLMGFIVTIIFIPRKEYKTYFVYGFLIGGLGDFVLVGFLQNVLHIMHFQNQGVFNVLGQIALSPPSWTVVVMIFLFFLPRRRPFLYIYLIAWASYSVSYGYVVHNVGLFDFLPWFYPIPAFLLFLIWWVFAAWIFLKTNQSVD